MLSQVFTFAVLLGVAMASLPIAPLHHYEHHAPQPYKFGYSVKDHHGEQHREESGDGGHGVRGSYGFTDDRGIHRQVNYVADHAGFRAQVKTNEPGTANQNPAAVHIISDAPLHHDYGYGHGHGYGHGYDQGHGYGQGYGYGVLPYAGYGHGYAGYGYGLGSGLLGGLGYYRYGY